MNKDGLNDTALMANKAINTSIGTRRAWGGGLKRGDDRVHLTCSTSMLFPMLEAVMSPLYLRNVEIQSLRVGNTWYVMEWLWSISSWGNIRQIHSLHHIPYSTNISTKLNLHTSLFFAKVLVKKMLMFYDHFYTCIDNTCNFNS